MDEISHEAPARQETLTDGECAAALRAIADRTRLHILRLLFAGERSVSAICRVLDLEQHFVSRHLAVLRSSRLVLARRDAQRVVYSVHPAVRRIRGGSDGVIDLGCCELRFPCAGHGGLPPPA